MWSSRERSLGYPRHYTSPPLIEFHVSLNSARSVLTKTGLGLTFPHPCFWPVCVFKRACSQIPFQRPAANKVFKQGHYVIPDNNIFLHCMDAIGRASVYNNIVVLQVRKEMHARWLPLYLASAHSITCSFKLLALGPT